MIGFLALSCVKENPVVSEEMVTVDYGIDVAATKAFGEGSEVNYIWYALYRTDGTYFCTFTPAEIVDGVAHCPVSFIKDQEFKVVFVGMHHEGDTDGTMEPVYEMDAQNAVMKMPVSSVANSEKLDCFIGSDDIVNNKSTKSSIKLRRLGAQVNFICKEEDWPAEAVKQPNQVSLEMTGVSAGYDIFREEYVSGTVTVSYDSAALPSGADAKLGSDYRLCTVYCLAGDDPEAELKLFKGAELLKTVSAVKIPLAGNMKTNVYINN